MRLRLVMGLVLAAGTLLAIVALQPSSFSVERSLSIDAPSEVVFDQIASLRKMDVWSPYAQMDPEMEIAYEGPEAGVGARSAWAGPQVGQGRLTITGIQANERVEMRLEMLKPLRATNRVVFVLAPTDVGTDVRWRMDGESGFVGKAIGLVMDMDAMLGQQFESGLASLARVAEAAASGRSS
jgi:Polyketide cyclase / dehydrase and lipid transport